MEITETRAGDINARAGIIVKCGNSCLFEMPTSSSKYPNPMLDIPKGHIQQGESPINTAIRECYEETNIKFEKWKLTKPTCILYSNAPLYLFLAEIDTPIPTDSLSCVSTFVDEKEGVRKPECCGYVWLEMPQNITQIQSELRQGIRYYFPYTNENCQISTSLSGNIPQNVLGISQLGYKNKGKFDSL